MARDAATTSQYHPRQRMDQRSGSAMLDPSADADGTDLMSRRDRHVARRSAMAK